MKAIRRIVITFCFVSTAVAQQNLYHLRSEFSSLSKITVQETDPLFVEKKSPTKAVFYSLLLPGMGELYADGFDEGRYSLIAEGGLWLTYISFRQYGSWLQDDARNYASSHAGAAITGKNDQYFVNLGNFNDTYEYNDKQLQDRELIKVYDVNSGYYWRWDTDNNRREYRALRVSSERVLNNSKFVIATIVVNRIISAINAARLVRLYNQRNTDPLGSWWLESSLINDGLKPDGLKVSIIHRF
ncbi:MAG: hypothetical protein WCX28_03045 [Bacteriovoracaceae bacterium]|nr:hypothetical protein [Bacteroidota bacterium]